MTLEDESGRHYQLKYIAYKTGLSAGWRQFAASHNLIEGDVLVFQLIEPTKFKVYIIRSNDLTEVDGALGLLNLDNRTKQKDADKDTAETSTVACNDSNRKRAHSPPLVLHKDTAETSTAACNDSNRKCAHSPPLVLHKDTAETSTAACNDSNWKRAHSPPLVLHKDTAETSTAACNDSNRKRAHSPPLVIQKKKKASMQQAEQSENGSEEVDSEVSEDPKLPFIARHFEDIQSFDNFSILVNGSLVDSEFPKEVRKKYYKLCCSQNAFLHENFIEGMNHNLVIGAISETVNIADAIKACKLTTARDDFMSWEKCLIAFELLGMNVGFLRDRVCRLANFANDSDAAVEARMYKHSKIERSQAGIGIRTIETKLDELRDACDDFGAAIESLRSKAEAYTLRFQEEAASPW